MKNTVALLFLLVCMQSIGYGQNKYTYSQPAILDDGWKTNNLQSQQLDSINVCRFFNQLSSVKHALHSIILIKNGEIIIEEYFGDYSVNKQHDLRSVTKSITSILIGIAVDKGFIDSIDDPISKYLNTLSPTKHLDKRKEDITIRHLLTMSSGLDCNDWDKKSKGQEDRIYRKSDWLQSFIDLPMLNDPGAVSNYCTMGQVLATEIVSQASGRSIDQFAEEYVLHPLGINNYHWGHTSNKQVIPSAKRIYLTSRDMGKIGQLMLNKGKWGDTQVVSPQWVHESMAKQTKITGLDYGFFWWTIPFNVGGKEIISKTATGNGGQYIMVFPDENTVGVFTGGAYNSQNDKLPFKIMQDVFLPASANK
ncbi:MAG: serine hydrolase [Pricia sp.]|nr:serine hydrolase [Pricia sp.]